MYAWLGLAVALSLLLALYILGSIAVACTWRMLDGIFKGWSPRRRADLLFALRLLPAASSIFIVFFLVLPAYWVFEPLETKEEISLKLAVAAALAMGGIAVSAGRVAHSLWTSRSLTNEWLASARQLCAPGLPIEAYRFDHEFPVLAITGIARPRLFVANRLLESMTPRQMDAALAHEAGHLGARDNLRRFLLTLFPDVAAGLGRAWTEAAEMAADAHAARQSAAIALDLASALIDVARMAPAGMTAASPRCMQLLASGHQSGLADRVNRLLSFSQGDLASGASNSRWSAGVAVAAVAAGLVSFWSSPVCLHATHEALESFVRLLS